MSNSYIEQTEKMIFPVYSRFPIVMDRGDGVYLYDIDGKKYLDFGAGIAVFSLGYNNKEYNDALKAQIDKLLHTSNYFYNVPLCEAADKFLKASKMDYVFFTNSGTEAIEGAIKLAKKYAYKKKGTTDNQIISMNHSFHGRSMGALAVTGQPKYQEAFGPMIDGVVFAEFNNFDSVKSLINEKTCAIILEPIQGEGGLYPADPEFMKNVRRLCDEKGLLLICDEIQTGMGRTGTMFAYENYGIKPDIMTSAKALGCGIPVGAFAATKQVGEAFEAGDHGTTYGGNPFATAAVSKVFDLYEKEDILGNVAVVSKYLEEKLDELIDQYTFVKERRGMGLMQGLELDRPVKEYMCKAFDKGLIILSAGTNILRFVPPLTITKENVDDMIGILKSCFE